MHTLECMLTGTTVRTHNVHVKHNCEKKAKQLKDIQCVPFSKQQKSLKQLPLEKVESALAAWFKQACANSGSVGGTVIRIKALYVTACLGLDSFTGSSGWIDRFMRHCL